ncbi:putative Ig domain-containing protein [Chloroflexi bacterium TSY]|nr:putative Ig domain-containing protein [Chloroflexi bacterium TSY]
MKMIFLPLISNQDASSQDSQINLDENPVADPVPNELLDQNEPSTVRSALLSSLFSDDFNRADNTSIGNGWQEVETGNARVELLNNRFCVVDASDRTRRPLASHTFQNTSTGILEWSYDIDWTRTGNEGTYHVYMQLGDDAKMSHNNSSNGVGVNLIWTRINGTDEMLGYQQSGTNIALSQVNGAAQIKVRADLDTKTYEVSIDGNLVQAQIPFDNNVSLSAVRFMTDGLNEQNFSGRCFDNLDVSKENSSQNIAPSITSSAILTGTTGVLYNYDVEADGSPVPTYTLTTAPAGMTIDQNGGLISWTPNTAGAVNVEVAAINATGSDIQAFTIHVTDPPSGTTLFSDDFNRADSAIVNSGWTEVEVNGAETSIQSNRLCFVDTSDVTRRPIVAHAFQEVSSGELTWSFDFDWARTGTEGTYSVYMQLGDGSQLSNKNTDNGIGVNLVWTRIGNVHETLGYRQGKNNTALTQISGPTQLSVKVDVDTNTYELSVNGNVVQSNNPFDKNVPLNTIRFLTDGLNEQNFSGRCFDNVEVQDGQTALGVAPAITTTPLASLMAGHNYSYDVDATGSPVPTYSLASAPAGMTIDANSGVIHWTPTTSGVVNISVVATNSAGSHTQNYSIHVIEQTLTCGNTINIMLLGDSITRGFGTGDQPITADYNIGYRRSLFQSLINAGYDFDFVGSLHHGTLTVGPGFDYDHEGHGGERDDFIAHHIYNDLNNLNSGNNWLTNTPAEVILLHIGTNDVTQGHPNDLADILDEIDEYETAMGTDIIVVLAEITLRTDGLLNDTITRNSNVVTMAQARMAAGDKIILVDHANALNYVDDMFDAFHPNNLGYEKMATVWHDALVNILPDCSAIAPAITSTALLAGTVGQLYTYDVDATGTPTPTYSLTASPVGMTINATTGLISWTPNVGGTFPISVTATNAAGSDTQSYSLVVSVPTTPPSITSSPVTAATVGTAYTYDVDATGNPTPTYSLSTGPAGMTIDANTGLISWSPTVSGTVNVEVVATNAGGSDAQVFSVNVTDSAANTLFSDDFDRADSGTVGNGWSEVEKGNAQTSIVNNRLCFVDTSDATRRPIVHHSFTQVSSGALVWSFDFDWTRIGTEGTYALYMQLGDSTQMSNSSIGNGVGVNLVWTNINNAHETLGYRQGNSNTGLTTISGPTNVSVRADLNTHTYEVSVDSVVIQSNIPFDSNVSLDTVRS